MTQRPWLGTTIDYSFELLNAGISGLHAGESSALKGQPLSPFVRESARTALVIGAGATVLGLLGCRMAGSRRTSLKGLACGALAFSAGLVWTTRGIAASGTRAALKQMSRVRDEHWLQLNPIDYA